MNSSPYKPPPPGLGVPQDTTLIVPLFAGDKARTVQEQPYVLEGQLEPPLNQESADSDCACG